MATFITPTWEQNIKNRLGEFGVAFPVGYSVVIDGDENVTTFPGAEGLVDPTQTTDVAAAGSGEQGYAWFRGGREYTITAGEATILDGAGYGDFIT